MVSHLFIGRDLSPVSWCRDEDQVDSSDTFAFCCLGSFLPHDPHCGQLVSASVGGAIALCAGSGSAVGSSKVGWPFVPPRRLLPWLITVALFNNAIPFSFFAWGERTVPSN